MSPITITKLFIVVFTGGEYVVVSLLKVDYTKRLDATSNLYEVNLYYNNGNPNKKSLQEIIPLMEELFKYKDKCWEYENEYRIIIPIGNEDLFKTKDRMFGDRFNFDTPRITGIYFGANSSNFKEADKAYFREDLIRICEERKIQQYQMKLDEKSYKLFANKIN